jgi:uncharacterized membrane protein YczE
MVTLIGWTILILSWIIPLFIKDTFKKRLIGISLSALTTGIFIGAHIQKYWGQ